MAISVANGILLMRQWLEDTSSTIQGASDDELVRFINERYAAWWKLQEKRLKEQAFCTLAANDYVKTSGLSTAEEIVSVNRVVPGGVGRTAAMERMEWNEIRNLQDYDSTTGTPIRYATYKGDADQTWQVATHPVPDAAYTLNAVHTLSPAEMTTASTPILGNFECYCLYRLAAYDYAFFNGREDKAESILQPIPDNIRGKFGLERKRLDPKDRELEARI